MSADEGIRRGTSVSSLAKLKPSFKEDGRVHAGNSSQISDGAAALIVTTSERARELGLTSARPISQWNGGGRRSSAHADRSDPRYATPTQPFWDRDAARSGCTR